MSTVTVHPALTFTEEEHRTIQDLIARMGKPEGEVIYALVIDGLLARMTARGWPEEMAVGPQPEVA